MNSILAIFIFLLILKLATGIFLDRINLNYAQARADKVPESFKDFIDLPTYQKSIEYTGAKTRFSVVNEVYSALLLAGFILTGLLAWFYELFSAWFGFGVWGQALVLFCIGWLYALPLIPFDWWSTFRLEERFGFNKSTQKLWITDQLKNTILGAVIACPLLALLIYLVEAAGGLWWVWGFVVFFIFQLVMVVVYPMYIMPLFNKLEPLEAGDLKTRLFELANRTGFRAQTILVMDGSKRSGHSNAFFAGFGKFRRIVLYDTLIEQMEAEELEAVLAHEIGHYKLGHIPKRIVFSGLSSLLMFAVLGWMSQAGFRVEAFHFESSAVGQIVPVFLLVMLLSGTVTFWFSPLLSCLSRKHEYQADHFAREAMGGDRPLVRALRKLHKRNLSNLTPHPLYSGFYYSHPTLVEREAKLRAE